MSNQIFKEIESFLNKKSMKNKNGLMSIVSMKHFIESREMETETFNEIDDYLERRRAKSKSNIMTITGIKSFIYKLKTK